MKTLSFFSKKAAYTLAALLLACFFACDQTQLGDWPLPPVNPRETPVVIPGSSHFETEHQLKTDNVHDPVPVELCAEWKTRFLVGKAHQQAGIVYRLPKSGKFLILTEGDPSKRFYACNLPAAFQKNSLHVNFSGELRGAYQWEKWPGTPLILSEIKLDPKQVNPNQIYQNF